MKHQTMTSIRRRVFLAGSAAVALGGAVSSPVAWASGSHRGGVHERVVRDARMEWRRLPDGWQTAPFLGNGRLAAHVYRGARANELTFMLNHSVVQDQREYWEAAIGLSRLPIGYLTLAFAGTITGVDWRLNPWDAELSGIVTTTLGSAEFTALVLNDRDVLLVSLSPSAGEESAQWTLTPLRSATTRTIRVPPDYVANPDPTLGTAGEARSSSTPRGGTAGPSGYECTARPANRSRSSTASPGPSTYATTTAAPSRGGPREPAPSRYACDTGRPRPSAHAAADRT